MALQMYRQSRNVEKANSVFHWKTWFKAIILGILGIVAFVSMCIFSLTPAHATPAAAAAVGNATNEVIYVHTATAANSVFDWTTLNNSVTNGNPHAVVFVTPNWNPGGTGGVYDNHPIGVWYTGQNWAIFNQDLAAIPVGASFNVYAFSKANLSQTFVHTATAANSVSDWTNLNNSITNGHPHAVVFVTPNWNPGGTGGVYNNHPIGVWYTGQNWAIFNQDLTAIPAGASFNVYVFPSTNNTRVFVHTATAANSISDWTNLNNIVTNGNPHAVVFVTPNWNPGGVGGVYDNHSIGVWYTGQNWAIFNQDVSAIPQGASFNIYVFPGHLIK